MERHNPTFEQSDGNFERGDLNRKGTALSDYIRHTTGTLPDKIARAKRYVDSLVVSNNDIDTKLAHFLDANNKFTSNDITRVQDLIYLAKEYPLEDTQKDPYLGQGIEFIWKSEYRKSTAFKAAIDWFAEGAPSSLNTQTEESHLAYNENAVPDSKYVSSDRKLVQAVVHKLQSGESSIHTGEIDTSIFDQLHKEDYDKIHSDTWLWMRDFAARTKCLESNVKDQWTNIHKAIHPLFQKNNEYKLDIRKNVDDTQKEEAIKAVKIFRNIWEEHYKNTKRVATTAQTMQNILSGIDKNLRGETAEFKTTSEPDHQPFGNNVKPETWKWVKNIINNIHTNGSADLRNEIGQDSHTLLMAAQFEQEWTPDLSHRAQKVITNLDQLQQMVTSGAKMHSIISRVQGQIQQELGHNTQNQV